MKIVREQGGDYSVRLYISGGFEIYYEVAGGSNQGHQNEIHVMDDTRRIATIRLGEAYSDTTDAIKFVHSDQVECSTLLTSSSGTTINQEEYYAFGETSYGQHRRLVSAL